jgi:putative tricarboxylic transport membrane protein
VELFLKGLILVFDPLTFLLMVAGVAGGVIIGALPGMTASMGIILLLPLTYKLPAQTALVMLCGMYCGAMYGGSISAILINTPGTPSASATVLDGFPLTQQGKAGKALAMAILGSFVGGLFSSFCLLLIAPQLAKVALKFQAADYFSLAIFGLTIMASSSGKNLIKGLISGWAGLLLSTVGIDGIVGVDRFTFGIPPLMSGFSLLPVLIGVFALSQVLVEVETKKPAADIVKQELTGTLPTWGEVKLVSRAMAIGSVIGVIIGIIPGTGGAIACFMGYNEARRWSKHKEQFGKGSLEGVAAPESANNATTGGALVPMLTLGVPGDVVTAVMLGALMLIGVRPGPLLFVERAEVVYTLLAGMVVIQFVMLFLGMYATKVGPRILSIPYDLLMPVVVVLCVVGAYTLGNSLFDVLVAVIFGVVGYFMRKYNYPGAPLVLGIILGPMAEDNLNRALLTSYNDWSVLVTRPISLAFLILSVVSIATALYAARPERAGDIPKK